MTIFTELRRKGLLSHIGRAAIIGRTGFDETISGFIDDVSDTHLFLNIIEIGRRSRTVSIPLHEIEHVVYVSER